MKGPMRRFLSSSSLNRSLSSFGRGRCPRRRDYSTDQTDPGSVLLGEIPPPTRRQLRALFLSSAIPMVGFGFMDQTVMLQAGNAIDMTIGVTFGLSTLAAAAFGQICSDAAGVLFGGTVENVAKYAGVPRSGLTSAQRGLMVVKRAKLLGSLVGVLCGCSLGLLNLLIIDTERPVTLKIKAMSDEQEFAFEVEASNADRDDATTVTVRGPDVDGVLASMSSALVGMNCSLVSLTAKQTEPGRIEDVFTVVKHGSGGKIDDDDLDELALAVLEATHSPINLHTFKSQVKELQDKNKSQSARIQKLEQIIKERNIKVVREA